MNQRDKITRRNALEDQLQNNLDLVIEKIKLRGIKDTNIAQQRYGNEVNAIMRSTAQQAYELGIQEVVDMKKTVGFLTTFDTETIKKQVEKYAIKFWLNVHAVIHRNDVLLQKRHYVPRSPLNSNYMATKIAIALITTTLALAVSQKALILQSKSFKSGAIERKKKCPKGKHWDVKLKKCVDDEISTPSALPFAPEPIDFVSPLLGLGAFFIGEGDDELYTEDVETEYIVLVWNAILDDRTCPVCETLDGTTWLPDDADLPTPGDEGDIHSNCRCFWDVELQSDF